MFDDDDRTRDWAGGGSWQNDDPPPPPPPPPPPKKRKTKPVPSPSQVYRPKGGRGLVAGRFDPLHRGHEHLIEVARRSSSELDVVVFRAPNDAVPIETRVGWIRDAFPGVAVYETVSTAFATAVENAIKRKPSYDALYSADVASGIPAAKAIGATFVPVDPLRETYPMAATNIRTDVMAHFDDIASVAREWFVRRVAIVGPESTGKTELAKRLAHIYSTRWVPEPARAIVEAHGGDLEWDDLERWTRTQMAAEDAAARHARRVLFSDTDATTPSAWAHRIFGEDVSGVSIATRRRRYDLTLVCVDDIPFVGRPQRDDPEGRREMMQLFLQREKQGAVPLRGSLEERVLRARKAIDQLLATKRFFSARGEAMLEGPGITG